MPPHHDDQFTLMIEILKDLAEFSHSLWSSAKNVNGSRLSDSALKSYEGIVGKKTPMQPGQFAGIAKKFPQGKIDLESSLCYYLPPLMENVDFVPILFAKCELDRGKCEFRVELYQHDGAKFQSIGIRFESPDGGRHDYWHAHMMNESRLHSGLTLMHGAVPWLPTTIPCIPLAVENPLSLLVCIILSLYGRGSWIKILPDIDLNEEELELLARNGAW